MTFPDRAELILWTLSDTWQSQRSAATDRINAAVPTEWVRVRKGEQVVELKRTVATKNGSPNTVEMRLAANSEQETEEPSTISVP